MARATGGIADDFKFRTDDAYFRLVINTPAESFAIEGPPEKTPIFVAERHDKLVDVFRGMIEKNILSVPVLLREEKRYFGFIDMADIVRYIVSHFGARAHHDRDFWELVKEEEKFQGKTVNDIMQYPVRWRNPFHPVVRGYSAMSVLEPLAHEPDLLRIPIVDRDTRQMYNLVTISQYGRWLHQNIASLGTIKDKPLSLFTVPLTKKVVSVSEDDIAITAFQKMIDENVTGVAVVNEAGRLMGALSMRDIKIISHDARLFWRLNQTVHNFLLKLRSEYQEKHSRPQRVVSADLEDTLANVVEQLATERIHNVFIINNHREKKLIGVVNLKDIANEILNGYKFTSATLDASSSGSGGASSSSSSSSASAPTA